MVKTIIIGGGFSAALARILLGREVKVITPKVNNKMHFASIRRHAFETNKLFSINAKSLGSLRANLKNGHLHDRLILGGNSSIWGGFIDLLKVPSYFISQLKNYKIKIVPLSKAITGSISDTKSIAQIQFHSEEIFDAAKLLVNSTNGYLESFRVVNDAIELCVLTNSIGLNSEDELKKEIILVEKLVLCIGVVQLIDLLYRSKIIKVGDEVSLYEFPCNFKLGFGAIKKKSNQSCIIQYTLGRALCHILGFQKYPFILRFIDILPIFINQEFFNKENQINLVVTKDGLSEKNARPIKKGSQFGASIHYCSMQINGEEINHFLHKISSNVIGLGMAFVKQDFPGPISNDILMDALKKLNQT